jgi:hypothetical protein
MIRFIINLARTLLLVVPFNWIAYVITFDSKFIWVSLACFVSGGYLYALAGTFDSLKEKTK